MSLNLVSSFNGVTDPDAGAYIAAVEQADGQLLEYAVGKAINDFVVGCKADAIWDALKASCILAGARTLSGALIPLKGTAPTNNNFVSGDYDRKTGLVGDGSTKYLNSNRNNNADPRNSRHMSLFAQSGFEATTANNLMGSSTFGTGPGPSYSMMQQGSGNIRFLLSNDGTLFSRANAAPTAGGLYGMSRSSSVNFISRFNNANVTHSSSSVALHSNNHFVFCRNADGSPLNYSNAASAFYSIGESLDLARLDTRVTALINAISAGTP